MPTPIIKIEVNSDEFDSFREKFAKYQEELAQQKSAWAGSNEAVKILSSRFEDAAGSFDRLNKAATNPKFAGETGVFTKFQKSSLETGKSWTLITKQIEKSSKGLNGLAREMLSLGKLSGGLAGAAVGGAAALYGATSKASSDLAGKNAQNRRLHLAPGVIDAYGTVFAKYGGDEDQLASFAKAKTDTSMWNGLVSVGITPAEIQGDDAETLAEKFMQRGGAKWNSMPEYMHENWLAGTGAGQFADTFQMNQAASYGPDDYAKSHDEFIAQRDKLALPQSEYDAGTKAKQEFENAKKDLGSSFDHVFVKLAPEITDLTKGITAAVNAFARSKELDTYLKDLSDDFRKLDAAMAWVGKLADKVSPLLPSVGTGGDALDDLGLEVGKKLTDLDAWDKLGGALSHTGGIASGGEQPRLSWNMSHPFGTIKGPGDAADAFSAPGTFVRDPNRNADITMLERTYGMPPGYLGAHEQIESSGGKNNTNPKNPGVAGAMQFDAPTAEKYGVNRYDEKSSLEGGARYLADLRRKYGGDWAKASAAYDGFGGLDRDIAEHGDRWRDYIGQYQKSGETAAYLDKLEAQGVDLNGNSGGHVGVGTVAAMSKIAGFHPDNQIIDTGSSAGGNQPPILSRPAGMGNIAAPTLNVNVMAPPGSSVSVTTAGFPQ